MITRPRSNTELHMCRTHSLKTIDIETVLLAHVKVGVDMDLVSGNVGKIWAPNDDLVCASKQEQFVNAKKKKKLDVERVRLTN